MKDLGSRSRASVTASVLCRFLQLAPVGVGVACGADGSLDTNQETISVSQAITPSAGDVVVSWGEAHQTIAGFGAAAVFWAADISQAQAEFFFSQPKGLGLSLLRVSAKSYQDNNGTLTTVPTYCPEIETAKKAQALGARVWAASWTPPPAWKTNGAINGKPMAHLQTSHYGDFAQSLADFAKSMTTSGVPLFGISPQNEPDHEADWEGCMWTAQEMTTFIRDQLGPKLAAASPSTQIIAPDSASWGNLPGYADAMLADPVAKGYLGVVATHPYGGGNLSYSAPAANGKDFWETEISQEHFPTDTPDPSMTSAITMLRMIHDHMTVANMNAWHWWAMIHTENPITDQARQNPGLIQAGVTFKRAYALGNFAKFVRPGMKRIGATASPATDILVSAYRDDTRVSIVAVNASSQARVQKFWLDGSLFGQVIPWVTSDALSLAKQPAIVATDQFSYALPAKSVVSFVNWVADAELPPPSDADGGSPSAADAGMDVSPETSRTNTGDAASEDVTHDARTSLDGDARAEGAALATPDGASEANGGGGAGSIDRDSDAAADGAASAVGADAASAMRDSAAAGSSASAGAGGAAGASASAGAGGAAAAAGAAGAPNGGKAGAATAGGISSGDKTSADASGCGCRMATPKPASGAGAWLAFVGAGAVFRRARRSQRRAL